MGASFLRGWTGEQRPQVMRLSGQEDLQLELGVGGG